MTPVAKVRHPGSETTPDSEIRRRRRRSGRGGGDVDGAIPEPAGWPLEGQVVRPTPLRGVGVKKKYAATVKTYIKD